VSGPSGQRRWRAALADIPVGWVGIRCVCCSCGAGASSQRSHPGDGGQQALAVHRGIPYDLEVDTDAQ
jgi:chloramphenicol 3-O phosphotransferase